MALSFKLAGPSDASLFDRSADGVFDRTVDPELLSTFLHDGRHHIAVALDDGLLVGFVSAVDYIHPDKARQLWINEVGVASSYRRRGIGKRLLELMFHEARRIGCTEAWVLTDADNEAANALYKSVAANSVKSSQTMHAFHFCQES
jgi:ribosomal protein S18 acetylase RimI-like enzyme